MFATKLVLLDSVLVALWCFFSFGAEGGWIFLGLLSVATAYRLVANVPILAGLLLVTFRRRVTWWRPSVSLISLLVYVALVVLYQAIGGWPGTGISGLRDLPGIYFFLAGATLVSPFVPWLHPPGDRSNVA